MKSTYFYLAPLVGRYSPPTFSVVSERKFARTVFPLWKTGVQLFFIIYTCWNKYFSVIHWRFGGKHVFFVPWKGHTSGRSTIIRIWVLYASIVLKCNKYVVYTTFTLRHKQIKYVIFKEYKCFTNQKQFYEHSWYVKIFNPIRYFLWILLLLENYNLKPKWTGIWAILYFCRKGLLQYSMNNLVLRLDYLSTSKS